MTRTIAALVLAVPIAASASPGSVERAAGRLVAGDRAAARTLLLAIAPGDPDRAAARTLLAALDLSDGRDGDAAANAREAVDHNPSLDAAWRILCAALLRLGRRDLAADAALEWSRRASDPESVREARDWRRRLEGGTVALGAEVSGGWDSNVRLDPDLPGGGGGSARVQGHARASVALHRGAERAGLEVVAGETHHFDPDAEALDAGFAEVAAFGTMATGRRLRLGARVAPRILWSAVFAARLAEELGADAAASLDLGSRTEAGVEVGATLQDLHASSATALSEHERDGAIVEAGPSVAWGGVGPLRLGARARYRREALRSVEWRSNGVRAEAWSTLAVATLVVRARVEWLGRDFGDARPPRRDNRLAGELEVARPWGAFEPFVACGATALFSSPELEYRRFVAGAGLRVAWEGL